MRRIPRESSWRLVAAVSAVAVLAAAALAACGGSDDDSAPPAPPTPASLNLGGTAATGAAIAGATVEAKCKTGSGSATTSAAGVYAIAISGGELPCVARVAAAGAQSTSSEAKETASGTDVQKSFPFQILHFEHRAQRVFSGGDLHLVESRQKTAPVLAELEPLASAYLACMRATGQFLNHGLSLPPQKFRR